MDIEHQIYQRNLPRMGWEDIPYLLSGDPCDREEQRHWKSNGTILGRSQATVSSLGPARMCSPTCWLGGVEHTDVRPCVRIIFHVDFFLRYTPSYHCCGCSMALQDTSRAGRLVFHRTLGCRRFPSAARRPSDVSRSHLGSHPVATRGCAAPVCYSASDLQPRCSVA